MTSLTVEDGKLVVRDGALGTEQACCCDDPPPCCTCESLFHIYANKIILDGNNFDTGGNVTLAIIPGLGSGFHSWETGGCASNPVCDGDGNLIVRVGISRYAFLELSEGYYLSGLVSESRYYKFDLSGGGCGVIPGVPVALPADAGDTLVRCDFNSGLSTGAVIDGDIIRVVLGLSDGGITPEEELSSSSLHLDWDAILIEGSCQIQCPGVTVGGTDYASVSCESLDINENWCQQAVSGDVNCECQPVEVGSSTPSPEGYDPQGVTRFQCALNPVCPDGDAELEFTSCFGSGAAGFATIAGGVVTSATVSDGGVDYAKLGRAEPVLSLSASHSGSAATFTPSFSQSADACGLDSWAVSAISVTGGSGYTDGSSLSISVTQGTQVVAATATLTTEREEPTLSLSGNATVQITLSPSGTGWTISGVTVTNGGSGYVFDDFITVVLGANDQEVVAAELYVITDPGDDVLTGVDIFEGGEFFKDSGTPESVAVTLGGEYYLEDSDEDPYVDTVTVVIKQPFLSTGSGGSVTATIDSDTSSGTFGEITGLTVGSGGSNYLGSCDSNPLP